MGLWTPWRRMSAPETPDSGEFGEIAALFRPLTHGAPGAFDLLDDAAVVPSRPGYDLVITKDAVVEGVHTPRGEAPDLIARKLLRANLSDLAAKGAEPFGAFLAVAWPAGWGAGERAAFARGLGEDLTRFGVDLLGGDTVSTGGPATASMTLLGWVPEGRMLRRAGARIGDLLQVSGTIGDGVLGLDVALGLYEQPDLLSRYRLPQPRLDLRDALGLASAAADVSDGLLADAGHIALASGVKIVIDLESIPLSPAAQAWLATQSLEAGLVRLVTGGDDYEIVCTAPAPLRGFTVIGRVEAGSGAEARLQGHRVEVAATGWRHG